MIYFEVRKGTQAPNAKLTDAQAWEIMALYHTVPNYVLAKRFGISDSQICKIGRGKAWRHVRQRFDAYNGAS